MSLSTPRMECLVCRLSLSSPQALSRHKAQFHDDSEECLDDVLQRILDAAYHPTCSGTRLKKRKYRSANHIEQYIKTEVELKGYTETEVLDIMVMVVKRMNMINSISKYCRYYKLQ